MGARGETPVPLRRIAVKAAGACCLFLPLLVGPAACSWLFGTAQRIDTRTIDIQIPPGANHDAPVAIDIVYVFDEKLATQLQSLSASDWFHQRSDITALYPGNVTVSSYELVPGQLGPIEQITGHNTRAIGLFAFADYSVAGAHRARLDRFREVVIRLGADNMTIAPQTS